MSLQLTSNLYTEHRSLTEHREAHSSERVRGADGDAVGEPVLQPERQHISHRVVPRGVAAVYFIDLTCTRVHLFPLYPLTPYQSITCARPEGDHQRVGGADAARGGVRHDRVAAGVCCIHTHTNTSIWRA